VHDLVLFGRDWGFRLVDIDVPIRFWHGDADHLVPVRHARHLARLVPDAALTIRRGESHLGSLAAAEEILGTILSLWPGARSGTRVRTSESTARQSRRAG
jgi:pimeloyl-ACP methyl ester carboxylesterase